MRTAREHYSISIESAPPILLQRIPAGSYIMGSVMGLPHAPEGPEHAVEIKEFWMADAPVTRQQFRAVMGYDPSHFRASLNLPVETVTWIEACQFCSKLGDSGLWCCRLPSEAEWEYACRAGSKTQYHFGDSASELPAYAWFEDNSRGQTHPVRLKGPNEWHLYDIVGNVWEWCLDPWHDDYGGAPRDGSPWLETTSRQQRYCVRGGAWDMNAFRCRSSYRSYDWEELGTSRTGIRVVASPG